MFTYFTKDSLTVTLDLTYILMGILLPGDHFIYTSFTGIDNNTIKWLPSNSLGTRVGEVIPLRNIMYQSFPVNVGSVKCVFGEFYL
jgi:hypothetical protein